MSALQDLLVTPIWMALVWVVHALCVMLEWCFTLNLLDSPLSGGVGRGLRQMQRALTDLGFPRCWRWRVCSSSMTAWFDDGLRTRSAERC